MKFVLTCLSALVVVAYQPPSAQAWVDAHNTARAAVNPAAVPPLVKVTWDATLAKFATDQAKKCGKEGPHPRDAERKKLGYGENMGASWSTKEGGRKAAETVGSWVSEKVAYKFEDHSCAVSKANPAHPNMQRPCNPNGQFCLQSCGHYTQVVWATTSRIGCGAAYCGMSGKYHAYHYYCNYAPAGNTNNGDTRPYSTASIQGAPQASNQGSGGSGGSSGSTGSTGGNAATTTTTTTKPAPKVSQCTYKTDGKECYTFTLMGHGLTLKQCQDKCTEKGTLCGAVDFSSNSCYYGPKCTPKVSSEGWVGYTKSCSAATDVLARLFKAMADFLA